PAGSRSSDLADPDGGVVEHRAAVRPARIGRRHGIDADAALELGVRPDTLDDHDAALLAGLGPGVHDRLAALVADLDLVAVDDAHGRAVLGIHHRRRSPLALLARRGLGEG